MTRLPSGLKTSMFGSCLLLSLPLYSQDKRGADASRASESLFPDWTPDAFDFRIGPILGGRARESSYGGVDYDTISSEIGLGARVMGIPLLPSNPGMTIEPYATYTWGNRTQKAKGAAINETESSGSQRHWYGALARFYFKSFRYSLDLGQGKINFDDDSFTDIKGMRIANDFGVLVLPFLSGHYTITSLNVEEQDANAASIKDLDHWLHARMAFSLFKFSLDVGPGRTQTKYLGQVNPLTPTESLGTVNTSYLKALSSLHIFWKLGASASAKYITSADKTEGFDTGIDQLPHQALNEYRSLAILPKGSLEASAFFGLRNLISGFGVGWQLYYLELSNDAQDKQISRDQGVVVSYEAGI